MNTNAQATPRIIDFSRIHADKPDILWAADVFRNVPMRPRGLMGHEEYRADRREALRLGQREWWRP